MSTDIPFWRHTHAHTLCFHTCNTLAQFQPTSHMTGHACMCAHTHPVSHTLVPPTLHQLMCFQLQLLLTIVVLDLAFKASMTKSQKKTPSHPP
jgi:hypothetical protein